MSKADIRDIEIDNTRDILLNIFQRSTRNTSFGMYQDVVNQANDYDFELTNIKCPVVVFQCEDDLSTPPAVGEYYKDNIHNCILHLVPNAGHLWHFHHMKDIFTEGLKEIDEYNLGKK